MGPLRVPGALMRRMSPGIAAWVCLSMATSPSVLAAQSEPSVLWQLVTMSPVAGKGSELQAGLARYLSESTKTGRRAWLLSIVTGPNTGQIMLERGPLQLKDNDESCLTDGGPIWEEEVAPRLSTRRTEFFRQLQALSHAGPGSDARLPVQYVRFFEVRTGKLGEAQEWLGRVSARLKSSNGLGSWAFFINHFEVANSDPARLAIASYHPSMSALARDFDLGSYVGADLGEMAQGLFGRVSG